jgi:hypothetical protein
VPAEDARSAARPIAYPFVPVHPDSRLSQP